MNAGEKKSIWERFETIDPRIVRWFVVILLCVPLVVPLGIPIRISEPTRAVYEAVESLPEGSIAWFDIGIDLGGIAEQGGSAIAMFRHLMRNNIKAIIVGTGQTPDCHLVWGYMLEQAPDIIRDKIYGEDYVLLGPVPGQELSVAALAASIVGTVDADFYGTPLDEIPIMEGISDGADIDFVWVATAGEHHNWYIRHWGEVYGNVITVAMTGPGVGDAVAVWQAGLIAGLQASQRGAAEYELITGKPGVAIKYMDMQSTGQGFILLVMILGNLGYVIRKYGSGEK